MKNNTNDDFEFILCVIILIATMIFIFLNGPK